MTRWTDEELERWKAQRAIDAKQREAQAERASPRREEEGEQMALFAWFNVAKWRGIPLSEIAFAVPNGAYLAGTEKQRAMQAARLQRMGLQPGFPDFGLPIPSATYHGLFVEMKRRQGGRVSPEQKTWLGRLRWLGYDCHVAEGADRAKQIVTTYLAGTGHALVVGYAPRPEIDFATWEIDR